jgi:hypothetical protein
MLRKNVPNFYKYGTQNGEKMCVTSTEMRNISSKMRDTSTKMHDTYTKMRNISTKMCDTSKNSVDIWRIIVGKCAILLHL